MLRPPPVYVIPRDIVHVMQPPTPLASRSRGPALRAQISRRNSDSNSNHGNCGGTTAPAFPEPPRSQRPQANLGPLLEPHKRRRRHRPRAVIATMRYTTFCCQAHRRPPSPTLAYTLIAHLRLCRDLPRRPRTPCTSAYELRVSSCLYTNTNVNTVPCPMPSRCVFVLRVYF